MDFLVKLYGRGSINTEFLLVVGGKSQQKRRPARLFSIALTSAMEVTIIIVAAHSSEFDAGSLDSA